LDSDSNDEVHDELPFLRQENERLDSLLDNSDDMLREAKKMRKEHRASLEDARTRVAELETQVLDRKLILPRNNNNLKHSFWSFLRATRMSGNESTAGASRARFVQSDYLTTTSILCLSLLVRSG
jgi:ElaB/YqjD/DUF883 family membrane-anchored ribosome-binding protein